MLLEILVDARLALSGQAPGQLRSDLKGGSVTLDELEALLEGSEVMFLEPREVFDAAIIGLAHRVDGLHVVAYDSERVVRALMDKHGLNEAEARDWYEFNTTGAYVGTGTPVFIRLCEQVV